MKAAKLLLALLLVLAAFTVIQPSIPPAHAVNPSLIQSGGCATTTASCTVVLSSHTAGDTIIVVETFTSLSDACSRTSAPTDSASNTYVKVGGCTNYQAQNSAMEAWKVTGSAGAGSVTVTCHWTTAGNIPSCYAFDVQNDGQLKNFFASGLSTSIALTAWTPVVGSLILATAAIDAHCAAVTVGSGYSALSPTSACTSSYGMSGESQAGWVSGTTTAPMTIGSSSTWGELVVEVDPTSAQKFISVSSDTCFNDASGASFTCSLSVTSGDTLVAFFSCVKLALANSCVTLTVSDSQSNSWSSIASVSVNCNTGAVDTCKEQAFKTTATSTGSDTFTFTSSVTADIGGQVYDLPGVSAVATSSTGNSPGGGGAFTVSAYTPNPNLPVVAGAAVDSPIGYLPGPTFSLVDAQPSADGASACHPHGCFTVGEFYEWGPSGTTTSEIDNQGNKGWAEVSVSFSGLGTINLTCIVKETGAPTETTTLTGGSPSPSTANCSTGGGTLTTITVTPSCTLTVTVATDGANTRYRFNASATSSTTQNISCPAAGASKSVTIWNYYELQNTYAASTNGVGPPTWDTGLTAAITGTVTGVAATTGCTISPTSGTTTTANCQAWFDYNLAASYPSTMSGAAANIRWMVNGMSSFTDTTGGNTHTATYYKQLQNTFTMTPTSPATWDQAYSKSITGTEGGVTVQVVCGVTLNNGGGAASCTGFADYNTAVSEPVSFAAVSGNWVSTPPTSFTDTTGGNTHNVNYKNIVTGSNTFKATPIGSTWDAIYNIAITGPVGGVSATVCTIVTSNGGGAATCSGSMDLPGTATFPATVGATTTEQWLGANPLAFTTSTSGNTFNVNYWLQFNNTFKATPNSPTTFDFTGTVAVLGTSLGGSTTLCNISIVSGQGAKSCHAFADTGTSATMPSTLNTGEWTNEPPAPIFKISSGGNTFNVLYDAGPITTNTIIGWNFPSGTTYSNALLPIIAPLLGGAALVSVMYMFKRKGDLVVTLWLLGVLLGTAFFALNNGTALTSDFIPFAMLVVEAFQFVAWIWISGIGGNPGGQQQ